MKKIFLILIILLASVLRLYKLESFPAGFNADEAALGYNAYSLMLTGRDEHGHPWPINLESFGDYKPAFYSYMLIPFIKVLGLTEFAVRLPSAIFGILAVIFIYLLCRDLTPNPSPDSGEGSPLAGGRGEVFPLVAALMLAISPWHLHFSRGAWEVNVATTMLLIGSWLVVKWFKSNKFLYLALGICHLALSMYTYQSARILAPLLGLGLFFLYRREFLKNPRHLVAGGLLSLALLMPLVISILTTDAGSRLTGVGLLADEGPKNRVNELRGQHSDWNGLMPKVLHNKPLSYSWTFLENYFDHWNGNFLFVNGDDIERNKVPEHGLFYLTDAILLALGLISFLKTQHSTLTTKFVIFWLLIAPLPAALTFQTPHALRAFTMVIPMTILIAVGINRFLKNKLIFVLLIALFSYQFARYLHQYYVHYPQTYPAAWEYGFKEVAQYIQANDSQHDRVIVTDIYDQPYILMLFYWQYPPEKFQTNHSLEARDRFNFSTVRKFDKYEFHDTPWDKVRDVHPALIVAAPEDIPEVGVNVVETINFPNGQPGFKIVSN
jgi:4-amino-4-deoxy-L-arabinose transferase-like glycosyltransferase